MSVVFAMLLFLFTLGWGSVFLVRVIQQQSVGQVRGPSEDMRHLIEAVDDLSTRVSLLEEERDFYRDLAGGDEAGALPPGQGGYDEGPGS